MTFLLFFFSFPFKVAREGDSNFVTFYNLQFKTQQTHEGQDETKEKEKERRRGRNIKNGSPSLRMRA
jgi:hypothetical protein